MGRTWLHGGSMASSVPWESLHSQLPVTLWCVNSDTVSTLWPGAPLSSSGLEEAL